MQPLDNSMGIPAFLSKLWKMVDDPKTDKLICWSKDGKTFIIRNEVEFWYTLLPAYYKHNNMSSFVRQLNMYGFHKVSNMDNDTVDSDKVEYQFLHPFFQRGQPALLKNIKRKVTNSKVITSNEKTLHNLENKEQLNKVLSDVKYLYGRQAQVDTVLTNLKQENSVLWRELAVLRQKHQKQQQIVNKLIQFLVTIVQPSARMGGLGVKRRYPLMINESPPKKQKTAASDGPTIHELDSADVLPEELFEDDDVQDTIQAETAARNSGAEKVESPPSTSQQTPGRSPSSNLLNVVDDIQTIEPEIFLRSSNAQMDKPESAVSVDELLTDSELAEDAANIDLQPSEELENEEQNLMDIEDYSKVFLNPSSQDTLLTNLINGSYNGNALNGNKGASSLKKESSTSNSDNGNMTVATRDPNLALTRLNSVSKHGNLFSEDIDSHVGTTQSELEQLKEFLNGCNAIDTSYLLNLFNEMPSYGLTPNQNREETLENDLLSGSELAPYDSGIVDFNELFDDSTDAADFIKPEIVLNSTADQSINTPEVSNLKPAFPTDKLDAKK